MKIINNSWRFIQAIGALCLIVLFASACKKLIEVDLPIDKNTAETVFASTPTAVSALTGVYAEMAGPITGSAGIILPPAQMADETKFRVNEGSSFYKNDITANDPWDLWTPFYRNHIFSLNTIIENVQRSSTLPERARLILEGEARFTRAFLYFHLVNYYGDVPVVITSDFNANANIARSPEAKVYGQIEEDLLIAQQNLDSRYLDKDLFTTAQFRLRPNKGAATALLARIYLYRQQWNKAEAEATKVIEDNNYQLLSDLDSVFLKESNGIRYIPKARILWRDRICFLHRGVIHCFTCQLFWKKVLRQTIFAGITGLQNTRRPSGILPNINNRGLQWKARNTAFCSALLKCIWFVEKRVRSKIILQEITVRLRI
jgi:hypothetical protein